MANRDLLVFFDPATGLKKVEYRCGDVFTHQPSWFNDSDVDFNSKILFCPRSSCGQKIGIFSLEGLKCKSCVQTVSPGFQFFRSKLIQVKLYDQISQIAEQAAIARYNMSSTQKQTKKKARDSSLTKDADEVVIHST